MMKGKIEKMQTFVSIIIPCRNEERFISKCLDSIIANDYPEDKFEVLVVDGMSTDGTREILQGYEKGHPFIKVLDNPEKITPVAINIGIKAAKGEIVMIMSGHTIYKNDYILKCVRYLNEYKADNVGGVLITLPGANTLIGKAITFALSHPFGVGNSCFRTGSNEPRWVDTCSFGCYRKEVFDKIGLYNENLVRSQDMEFNLRLKKAGGKTLLHPEIIGYYHAKSTLTGFYKHNFDDGVWAIYPLRFGSQLFCLRHLIPLIFVLSLIFSIVLSFFLPIFFWLFLFIFSLYFLTNLYSSYKISLRERNFRYLFILPLVFAARHIGYGLGSVWGLLKVCVSKEFWKNVKTIII
ncbi:MAG: glycosyltransferase family 2 protein [Nitrospirota bacterium]